MEKYVNLFLSEENLNLLSKSEYGREIKFSLSVIDSIIAINWTEDRFKLLEQLLYTKLSSIGKTLPFVTVYLENFRLTATVYK